MASTPPNMNAPALPLPSGSAAGSGETADTLSTIWIAACSVMAAVPTIFVCLRFYGKAAILKQFNIADGCCLLGWIFLIAYLALELAQLKNGVGQHGWNISLAQYSAFAQGINEVQILYMPGIFFIKATILVQFSDFFVSQARNARWWVLWTLIWANAVFFTVLLFLEIFECLPREKIWNPSIPGHCLDINQTFVATASLNILDDFLILTLPMFWIWRLHMRPSRKIGIATVFATGLFACICSVMRLIESIGALSSMDITYSLVPVALWASAEMASGLIVACLPVLPRLIPSRQKQGKPNGSNSEYSGGPSRSVPLSTYRAHYEGISDDNTTLADGDAAHLGPETLVYSSPQPSGLASVGAGNTHLPVSKFIDTTQLPDVEKARLSADLAGPQPPPQIHRQIDLTQTLDPA